MSPANLFLTEDGMLKLGYYGLTTQEECCSIKKTDCDESYRFLPEVENGEHDMKSDVWSLGIVLVIMIGSTPRIWHATSSPDPESGRYVLDFDKNANIPKELVDFLQRCIQKKNERWSVSELMDVSGME